MQPIVSMGKALAKRIVVKSEVAILTTEDDVSRRFFYTCYLISQRLLDNALNGNILLKV